MRGKKSRVQEHKMSGKQEKIQYGLSKQSDVNIVTMVKNKCVTVQELKALTKIFSKEVMLPRQIVVCG